MPPNGEEKKKNTDKERQMNTRKEQDGEAQA